MEATGKLWWRSLPLLAVALGALANVLPQATRSVAATAEAPEVTRLAKRVCVDTIYTGDLVGYYFNPSCQGYDEFRCLPDEVKTTSGSFFNCARSGSVSPWPTQCVSRTLLFPGSSSRVCPGGCNTILWYTESIKPPFLSYTCGNGGTTNIYAKSEEIPQFRTTSKRSTTSSDSTSSQTSPTSSANTGASTPAGAGSSPTESPAQQSQDGSRPLGAIVGGSVGGAAVVLLALGGALFFRYKRRAAKSDSSASQEGKPELAGKPIASPSPGSAAAAPGELDSGKTVPLSASELSTAPDKPSGIPSELPPESRPYELDGTSSPTTQVHRSG